MRLALAVTPRRTLTGEPVEAAHPQTAAALADGSISTRAAATVVAMTDQIDDLLADQSAPLFETALLDFARRARPRPAGPLRQRPVRPRSTKTARSVTSRPRTGAARCRCTAVPDGSGTIAGELTCEAAEYLETLFDTLAKPHQGPERRT